MISRAAARLHHHYAVVKTIATKRVIKNFADHYRLVYFGSVSQHNDEHQLIKGVTLSADHKDRHYCVGSIDGYDVILVQRTDTMHLPGKQAEHLTWIVMQFDLHNATMLPHIFLNAHRYSDAFYVNLSFKFRLLQPLPSEYSSSHSRHFTQTFTTYVSQHEAPFVPRLISPDMATVIDERYKQFDFEIAEDKLCVYANNRTATRALLNDMTRAGLWFSKELDKQLQ